MMNEEQYNELLKAYTKEAFAYMIKADIRHGSLNLWQASTASSLRILRVLRTSWRRWQNK